MSVFIDLHAIQVLPPNNVNRDDTGSPKSALYGGVRRARVSSQSWKRAIRLNMNDKLASENTGVRTKRIVELLSEYVASIAPEFASEATQIAFDIFSQTGIKGGKVKNVEDLQEASYLVLVSHQQIESLARYAVAQKREGLTLDKKEIQKLLKNKNSIDLALFGRMVADVTDLNVDASSQVAHAISVHAVETEFDFYTAVDDHKNEDSEEDAGAGMIGTLEFNSSTLYRYATINLSQLLKNLGEENLTTVAVKQFVDSFVRSIPSGKQNTFANNTLPELFVVTIRSGQPVSYVAAFEDPVSGKGNSGIAGEAIKRLDAYVGDLEEAYGLDPVNSWVVSTGRAGKTFENLGDSITLPQLLEQLETVVAEQIEN